MRPIDVTYSVLSTCILLFVLIPYLVFIFMLLCGKCSQHGEECSYKSASENTLRAPPTYTDVVVQNAQPRISETAKERARGTVPEGTEIGVTPTSRSHTRQRGSTQGVSSSEGGKSLLRRVRGHWGGGRLEAAAQKVYEELLDCMDEFISHLDQCYAAMEGGVIGPPLFCWPN